MARSFHAQYEHVSSWFKAGFSSLCPAPLRQRLVGASAFVAVSEDHVGFGLQPTIGRLHSLDQPARRRWAQRLAKRTPVVLVLGESLWLRQRIVVPRGAAPPLDVFLAHALESLSPFRADEVYAVAATERSGGDAIDIRYALRKRVDPLLARLADMQLDADRIWLGDGDHVIDLGTAKSRRLRRTAYVSGGLAALALSLVGLALIGQYRNGEAERAALSEGIATLEARRRERADGEENVRLAGEDARRIAQAFAARPRFAPILATIAGRLDDTFRLAAIDLDPEGLRATLTIRSTDDPAQRLSADRFLPALAIQSIRADGDGAQTASVSVPLSALRSLMDTR
jgi:Tfp pilus assembly protein PilN